MDEPAKLTVEQCSELHPADLADHLQRLPAEQAREILQSLPPSRAAAVAAELEEEKVEELLPGLSNRRLSEMLRELPHHEAADLAQDLPAELRGEALAGMPPAEQASVNALLRYPEDTAGGIMTDRFIALHADQTLQEAQAALRSRGDHDSTDVSYLYVTDRDQRLEGVISLRDLVFGRPDCRVSELMNQDVRFLWVDADQEEIARQFEHYHYMGLPVLERDRRLVGLVRASDIIEVAQDEATEDMQLMVGLSGEERALTPWRRSIRRRLPWLLINLATAFLAAAVVNVFESTIATWTALAVFLPIIAGQGGNAGVQTLTVVIRDLALGEISMKDARPALFKEVTLGFFNGLAIGAVVAVIGYYWKGDWRLGLVAGLAMVLNMLAAALSGVLIPYGLKAVRVDPALASSIFLTTVTDVAGFFFFLGLAALGLKLFG
jgi:magnesium transporter